jgi:N6-L-threonylcarbamoyladenine synthase
VSPSPADRRDLILGIETSCDETAAAVVRRGRPGHGATVLSNIIASQNELHAEYKGVVPEIASRAHAERILPIVREALSQAGVSLRDIDAIAVGNKPGLIGSLLVGVAAAKALAWSLRIPIIGVDHVRAHLYAGCLDAPLPDFPALGLVVSGGHTSLYHCPSITQATRLGSTIDDAVGEAYDKAATILGLPFPGGPNLDRLAQRGDASRSPTRFPISRLGRDSLDFSFSGLKTALLYAVRGVPARPGEPQPPPPDLDDQARGRAQTRAGPRPASGLPHAPGRRRRERQLPPPHRTHPSRAGARPRRAPAQDGLLPRQRRHDRRPRPPPPR